MYFPLNVLKLNIKEFALGCKKIKALNKLSSRLFTLKIKENILCYLV
jgi:hypothetical protein